MKLSKKNKISIVAGGLALALVFGVLGFANTNSTNNALGSVSAIKNGEIQPVMSDSEKIDAFTNEGKYKLANIYGDISFGIDMVGVIGKEVPTAELNLLNGEKLNTSTFKGKPYVIEIVANWCDYCKKTSKDYMPDIVAKNTDLSFIQIFAEGNTAAVNTFYEEIEKDPADMKYVVPADDASMEFVSKLNVQGFPTWIFVDETGKASWVHSGLVNNEDFLTLRDAAFTGDKLYNMLNKDFDDSRTGITVDTVFNALSDDALSKIQDVEAEGSYMLIANLGRKFENFKAKDINGEEFDLSTLSGKKVVLDVEVADESFENVLTNAEVASDLAKYAKENNATTVQAWLSYYKEDELITGEKFRENHKLNTPYEYTVDATDEQPLEELYNIDIYTAPSQIYINEDGKIAGITTGKMTVEKMEKAFDAFYGEQPLYKMVREEVVKSEQQKENNVYKTIAVVIVACVALFCLVDCLVYLGVAKKESHSDEVPSVSEDVVKTKSEDTEVVKEEDTKEVVKASKTKKKTNTKNKSKK